MIAYNYNLLGFLKYQQSKLTIFLRNRKKNYQNKENPSVIDIFFHHLTTIFWLILLLNFPRNYRKEREREIVAKVFAQEGPGRKWNEKYGAAR